MKCYAVFYIDFRKAVEGDPKGVRDVFTASNDANAISNAFKFAPRCHIPHLISETRLVGPDRVVWKGAFERAKPQGETTAGASGDWAAPDDPAIQPVSVEDREDG